MTRSVRQNLSLEVNNPYLKHMCIQHNAMCGNKTVLKFDF